MRFVCFAKFASFGFGGANAHAILENYHSSSTLEATREDLVVSMPFVFSAASEASLVSYLSAFCEYLRDNENVRLRDLAYTLHSRRIRF